MNNFLLYDPFVYDDQNQNQKKNPSYRILIVEDEMIVAMDLAYKLEEYGYNIVGLIKNGQDAVHMAIQLHPDIIIMDIDLPGRMDGIAAAKMIQNKIATKIIFASGHSSKDPRIKRIIEEGIYPFVAKPYYSETLKDIIAEI
ncbi:response regulator [bacterium]|nr:response regulator [bacterium]